MLDLVQPIKVDQVHSTAIQYAYIKGNKRPHRVGKKYAEDYFGHEAGVIGQAPEGAGGH